MVVVQAEVQVQGSRPAQETRSGLQQLQQEPRHATVVAASWEVEQCCH